MWTAGDGSASGEDGGGKGFGSGGADLGASIGGSGCGGEGLDQSGCGLAGAMSISHPLSICMASVWESFAWSHCNLLLLPHVFLERPSGEHSCSEPAALPAQPQQPRAYPSRRPHTPLITSTVIKHTLPQFTCGRNPPATRWTAMSKAPGAISRGR